MGRMPWMVLSGGLLVGLAVCGCETCGGGRCAGRQPPPGYAPANPPSSTGMSSWNAPRQSGSPTASPYGATSGGTTVHPGTGSGYSSTSGSTSAQAAPNSSGPVMQTRGTTGSVVPPLPPQPNRGVSEKPTSYGEPVIRTTVPPMVPSTSGPSMPPPPEPPSPVLGRPDPVPPSESSSGFTGPSLTPPPAPPLPEPPLPPLPSRPELPN